MTSKEYLESIGELEDRLINKKAERAQLNELMDGVRGINYQRERVRTSNAESIVEKWAIRADELDREISRLLNAYLEKSADIIQKIEHLDNAKYYNLLYKRYVQQKTLQTIAEEMGYSHQYVKELHRKSLRAFDEKYGHFFRRKAKK